MPLPAFQPLLTAVQLGHLLKTTRKRLGFTQSQVGSRVGLSQNRVSYLESHPEDLSFRQLLGWCAALGLELRLGERDASSDNRAEW